MHKLLLFICWVLLSACGTGADPEQAARAESGVVPMESWRLVISLPQAALPVQLKLARDFSTAWLENGAERVDIGAIRRDGEQLKLRFPSFNNTFELRLAGDTLSGTLTLVKRGYEQVMPVRGQRGLTHRFSVKPVAKVDVTGRWEVVFTEDSGATIDAVAELDQQDSRVTGTFLTPTGDYRYLEGEVDGSRLSLSTFDGAHAYVFTALANGDGSLSGDMWSGTRSHESWVARRNFEARLPDPYALTFLKEGYDSLEFTFPDLAGAPVSLADEKYQGKVLLVTLSGTWCPNCADEVAFLSKYYRENQGRGLEIITLLYEHYEDFERAADRGEALREQYGIGYDVLVAGVSDKTLAAETLPMLNRVLAFPTMIFIGRSGRVRRIHTGFSGPGTGAYYAEFVEDFRRFVDELLAEPG